jgi:hypothetical protein
MTRTGAVINFYAASLRVVILAAALLLVIGSAIAPSVAHADAVDELVKQLEHRSDKVRLSAALNLTKLGNAKAILPLAKAVGNDRDKDVRAAAAVGLGKLVTASTSKSIRNLALTALRKAASSDESDFVKQQAAKALVALGDGGDQTSPPPRGGGGSIYVNIGPMSSKTGNTSSDPKLRALMVKIANKTMGKAASTMATTWGNGGVPTKSQLAQKGFQGFYIDGTLNTLSVKTSGSSSLVECKISMLLASFPDKSVFGFLSGGAKVQASSSPSDIALASEDCVAAVVEDLIAKKIVPTINTKAGSP